jgi:anti-sigma-K factor RskA
MAASLAHNRHVGNRACSKRACNANRPVPGSGCASAWRVINDVLGRVVVLVIALNAAFDRRFLEKRLPAFVAKYWACSRSDIYWKAEGIRSSALEFVAYSLGFFHDGHRAASLFQ